MYFTNNHDTDMAIVTCFFNWCGYASPVRNLNNFLIRMKTQGHSVFGVELSLTDHFETVNEENWIHLKVKKENICYQQEACINLVAKKFVPEKFTKIAWINCDLIFTDQNWYELTSKKLDECKLVQMYTAGNHTDKHGKIIKKINGSVYTMNTTNIRHGYTGHTGGALAARRELWDNGGLFGSYFVGGADTILLNTIYAKPIFIDGVIKSKTYLDWKNKICSYISKSEVGFIENEFIHEWHGNRNDRGYDKRHDILNKVSYDRDIILNSDGVLEIQTDDQTVYSDIMKYFISRNEDGKNPVL